MSSEQALKSTTGAGAVLIIQNQVLLVQMNYGPFKGHWILPGGMVESGEHPHDTAIREFKEETGLEVNIKNLIGVRYRLNQTNDANTYWIFNCELMNNKETKDIELTWDPIEIIESKFWPINKTLQDPFVREMTKIYIKKALETKTPIKQYSLSKDHPQNDSLWLCE